MVISFPDHQARTNSRNKSCLISLSHKLRGPIKSLPWCPTAWTEAHSQPRQRSASWPKQERYGAQSFLLHVQTAKWWLSKDSYTWSISPMSTSQNTAAPVKQLDCHPCPFVGNFILLTNTGYNANIFERTNSTFSFLWLDTRIVLLTNWTYSFISVLILGGASSCSYSWKWEMTEIISPHRSSITSSHSSGNSINIKWVKCRKPMRPVYSNS